MSFDNHTLAFVEHFVVHAPPDAMDVWYGPWNTILSSIFPSSRGYMVFPMGDKGVSGPPVPDLFIEVAKVTITPGPDPSLLFRTVLILEIKDPQYLDHGKEALLQQLRRETDLAFSTRGIGHIVERTAEQKLYWVGSIGSHWIYGEKEDNGQDVKPLTKWHNTTFDEFSYRDLLKLVEHVGSL